MSSTFYIDPDELSVLNGVIEPFTIRAAIALSNSDISVKTRSVKGEFEDGNPDKTNCTDIIITILELNTNFHQTPFVDTDSAAIAGLQTLTSFDWQKAPIVPFNDHHDHQGVRIDPESEHMRTAIESLSPSTDTGVPFGSVSMKCGFMYETYDAIYGTDSITHGGFTYDPRGKRYSIFLPAAIAIIEPPPVG